MSKTAMIAMSGGVDSSVAALLTQQQGYDCVGATMRLYDSSDAELDTAGSCCSLEDVETARSVANALNIPYHVFNFTDEFNTRIITRFIDSYERGETPNPCIDCNRYLKFDKLLSRAFELNIDYIVTGHYARIKYDIDSDRYLLLKGLDAAKDQSYVLYALTQDRLARTLFPLGEFAKRDIRAIAAEYGFTNANKKDSQDICFVRNGDYAGYIEAYVGKQYEHGDFVDINGVALGRHKGIIRYTIGQRKGLGISTSTPLYVLSKNVDDNTVTLCREEDLYTRTLTAYDFNWISGVKPDVPIRVKAKVRYKQPEQPATATAITDGKVTLEFDEPQRAIAKGQAVVLYTGDIVVGGGTIG